MALADVGTDQILHSKVIVTKTVLSDTRSLVLNTTLIDV